MNETKPHIIIIICYYYNVFFIILLLFNITLFSPLVLDSEQESVLQAYVDPVNKFFEVRLSLYQIYVL